jgi:photosystem II stability/assembly factor-like uncharacterized protein
MKKLIFITLLLGAFSCERKEGCTDNTADNYDSEAKKDNGTCVFKPICGWENYQISTSTNGFMSHYVTDIEEKGGVLYLILREEFTVTCSGIYKSEDLGKTWVHTFSNCGDFGSQPINLLPISEDTIYAVGSGTTEGSLIVSYNKGDNWEKKMSLYGSQLSDLGFVNSKVGYVSHTYGVSKTDDYGDSWILSLEERPISSLKVFSENAIYALGEDTCYKSGDAGGTWNIILQSEGITTFDFLDKDKGVVGGKNGLYLTVDGGVSWDKIYSKKVNKLSFMNANTIYIITDKGTIAFSVDAGVSWSEVCPQVKNNSFIKATSQGVFTGLSWGSTPSEDGERTGVMKK